MPHRNTAWEAGHRAVESPTVHGSTIPPGSQVDHRSCKSAQLGGAATAPVALEAEWPARQGSTPKQTRLWSDSNEWDSPRHDSVAKLGGNWHVRRSRGQAKRANCKRQAG